MQLISALTLLLLATISPALAKTKRTAKVAIVNNTPNTLYGVSVVHKYSDNYKNDKVWDDPVKPGQTTPDFLEVEYNTGFLTTGRDWWAVQWFLDDKAEDVYYTDPDNLRGLFDFFEKIMPSVMAAAARAAAGANPIAGKGAKAAAKILSKALFNHESTAGFKQHILREEDEGAVTEIHINNDWTVSFKSKSGRSDTKVSKQ
jgi:hypothetical protein